MALADQIVDVRIDVRSDTLTRASYSTLAVAAYHTAYVDRVRAYTDADAIATDFPLAAHPARHLLYRLVSRSYSGGADGAGSGTAQALYPRHQRPAA